MDRESNKKAPDRDVSYLLETAKATPLYSEEEIRCFLDQIAEKWTLRVMELLENGPKRFSSLRREMNGISQKMLTQTLRELERNGFVKRKVYPEVPPRVDYTLTPLGRSLSEPLAVIRRWLGDHADEITDARVSYDGRASKLKRKRVPNG